MIDVEDRHPCRVPLVSCTQEYRVVFVASTCCVRVLFSKIPPSLQPSLPTTLIKGQCPSSTAAGAILSNLFPGASPLGPALDVGCLSHHRLIHLARYSNDGQSGPALRLLHNRTIDLRTMVAHHQVDTLPEGGEETHGWLEPLELILQRAY